MKKRYLIITLVLMLSCISVYALTKDFSFNSSSLSFTANSKNKNVTNNFDKQYNLTTSLSSEDTKLEEEIKTLTKKATYLLLGDANSSNESSENYYKRYQDWLNLMYSPDIPKDSSTFTGLDEKSQEYKDSVVSGMAMPQIFNQIQESEITYSSYGNIRILQNNDLIISSIVIPNITRKKENPEEPMKYTTEETNLIMYHYFKKNKNDYQIYYLYGELEEKLDSYFSEMENNETKGSLAIAPSYDSDLKQIYNFNKLDEMTEQQLNAIYNANSSNIVFINGYYNSSVIASANGFFINNGLIVTTWSLLEKSLINGQYITIKDKDFNSYEIDGIVTANPETDIAVIKLKQKNNGSVKLGDYKKSKVEDPAIIISSKTNTGLIAQTGIILSLDNYIQTSIPLISADEGSPLFNDAGEVIGINTAKSTNASVSLAINSDVLKEIQNKFSNTNFDKIKTITFKELKEKYYYVKYNEEKVSKELPEKIWNKYSKIGDIKNTIKLELVKSNYKGNIVSLRYKNNISEYISSSQLASEFIQKLKTQGYKETLNSESKKIYKNSKVKVAIMEEFDYLIVVMEKI